MHPKNDQIFLNHSTKVMGKFILKDKSYVFAVHIIDFCRILQYNREYIVSKQLLRSGTAIGALVREAEFAESRADFRHKLSIALKEANETLYWLSLLSETYSKDDKNVLTLYSECNELVAILVAIIKKMKLTNQNS
jgi:four helix bundle protein